MVLVPQSGPTTATGPVVAVPDYVPVQAQRGFAHFTHTAGARLPRQLTEARKAVREMLAITGGRVRQ